MRIRFAGSFWVLAGVAGICGGASAQGPTREWVAIYDSGFNLGESAVALAVDADGNVFVTGDGWGKTSRTDYIIVKYDRNGRELWVAKYDGPGNGREFICAAALDPYGNFVITGRSDGDRSGYDICTIKYGTDGRQLWVARYDGPGKRDDLPEKLVIDARGNVYVTGRSWGGDFADDFVTIKYDPNGREVWAARYDGSLHKHDGAKDIAVDGEGNAYVTGMSFSGRTMYDLDIVTIKYDAAGRKEWSVAYNGPTDDVDDPAAIALDADGNVYVTGQSRAGHMQFVTIKYDAGGRQRWLSRYGGLRTDVNRPRAIGLDDAGYVYVTGGTTGITGLRDGLTIKYDGESGEPSDTWPDIGDGTGVRRYNGPRNVVDEAFTMAVDPRGYVYIAGETGTANGDDMFVLKYGPEGDTRWVELYTGHDISQDCAFDVTFDVFGNVYMTGVSWGTYGDMTTIKYSQLRD